jgi:hypothetical protein
MTDRLDCSTAARSSGWMPRAITSARLPENPAGSTPKIRNISSDHSTRLDGMCHDQLPTCATRWAALSAVSDFRNTASACLRLVMSWQKATKRRRLGI